MKPEQLNAATDYAIELGEKMVAAREGAVLLLCPFCGGEPIADNEPQGDEVAHYLRCRSCATEGPWMKNLHGAIRLWNTRVGETPKEPQKAEGTEP